MKFPAKLMLVIILAVIMSNCGSSRYNLAAYDYDSRYQTDEMAQEDFERKILYSAEVTIKVEIADSTNHALRELVKKGDGYISEEGTTQSVIRVKSAFFDQALAEVESMGKVLHKNVTGSDVTDEYYDYEIRLENAEKSRDRYLELLAKAENVEAALKVEKELERLNETIDLLKGKLKALDHDVEYSTITVYLRERQKPGVLGYVGIGLYESVKWLFVRG
jgi:hypothetical protein